LGFYAKNFTIGLGLGIIITSIAFFSTIRQMPEIEPISPAILTDEEVVERGKKLGMIFVSELSKQAIQIKDEQVIQRANELGMVFLEETRINQDEQLIDHENVQNLEETLSESINEKEIIEVYIQRGTKAYFISDLLYKKNIIDNADGFTKFLKEKNMTTQLGSGHFVIPKNSTYDQILQILLRTP
jgi:uncharacterized protein YjfI (DUF2170 family)